jgi:hypothetical protein
MNTMSRKPLIVALTLATALAAPMAFAQEQGTAEQAPPTDTAEPATSMDAQPAKKSWADVDINQDGSLSKDEAAAVPALAEVYDQADADADGALTADEYSSFVANAQGAASPAPETEAPATEEPTEETPTEDDY